MHLGMIRAFGTGIALAALLMMPNNAIRATENIIGVWLTEERDSKIEFSPCGNEICGRVVWLRDPTDENGVPFRDKRNPDPGLRDRPILGLQIFEGLQLTDRPGVWTGKVYNPDDGDTYKTIVSITPNGGLEVKGCVLGGLFCGSERWTVSSL